jgi:electron transfer flavoprotein beta subunit
MAGTDLVTVGGRVVALVSIGRHPSSGRARRAPLDARATELGLGLGQLALLHAGDPARDGSQDALREYLGMGVDAIDVLKIAEHDDALPPLRDWLLKARPEIVLTGACADAGEASGTLPYLLAAALGWAIIGNVVDVERTGDSRRVRVLQALPRGRRREIEVPVPCVLAVAMGARAPRPSAYAKAMRGQIREHVVATATDPRRSDWQTQIAKPRGKRLRLPKGTTAAARQQAATVVVGGAGTVLRPDTPEEAARAVLAYLREIGLSQR